MSLSNCLTIAVTRFYELLQTSLMLQILCLAYVSFSSFHCQYLIFYAIGRHFYKAKRNGTFSLCRRQFQSWLYIPNFCLSYLQLSTEPMLLMPVIISYYNKIFPNTYSMKVCSLSYTAEILDKNYSCETTQNLCCCIEILKELVIRQLSEFFNQIGPGISCTY